MQDNNSLYSSLAIGSIFPFKVYNDCGLYSEIFLIQVPLSRSIIPSYLCIGYRYHSALLLRAARLPFSGIQKSSSLRCPDHLIFQFEGQKKRARVHFTPNLKVGVFMTLHTPDVIKKRIEQFRYAVFLTGGFSSVKATISPTTARAATTRKNGL